MRSFRSLLAILLIAASSVTGWASAASNAVIPAKVGTQTLKWRNPFAIRLAISNSLTQPNANIKFDSDVLTALKKSVEAWQDAADVEFQIESTDSANVSPAGVAGDGVSLITIAPSAENVLLFSRDAQNEAARTRVFYNARGFITEADIVLNPYQQFSTDGTFGTFDLQSTLTHEIGHLLGLKHSAVLGSSMSSSFPKNGLFGLAETASRTLDDSDVAAVRELYGAKDDDLCCTTITGKIGLVSARAARSTHVWAEDANTGRVSGLADVGPDGAFSLAGLPVGTYNVYWQRYDEANGTSMGELASLLTLENNETKNLGDTKLNTRKSGVTFGYLGLNGQLADSAIDLARGQDYTVFIGGSEMDFTSLAVQTATKFVKVDQTSLSKQDLGNDVTVVSLRLNIDPQTRPGTYSLFVTREDGTRTALIGALRVD